MANSRQEVDLPDTITVHPAVNVKTPHMEKQMTLRAHQNFHVSVWYNRCITHVYHVYNRCISRVYISMQMCIDCIADM